MAVCNKIMLVDDEPRIIRSIQRELGKDEYLIISALSGEEALLKLEDNRVDLIISDQNMPGMCGIDFLKNVGNNYPDILLIMLTALRDINIAVEAINDIGIYKFILKPWVNYELRLNIRRALEYKTLLTKRNLLKEEGKSN